MPPPTDAPSAVSFALPLPHKDTVAGVVPAVGKPEQGVCALILIECASAIINGMRKDPFLMNFCCNIFSIIVKKFWQKSPVTMNWGLPKTYYSLTIMLIKFLFLIQRYH